MWPVLLGVLRTYAPFITLPFAGVVGAIGYYIEGLVSDKYTPPLPSVMDQRAERWLETMDFEISQKENVPFEGKLPSSLPS